VDTGYMFRQYFAPKGSDKICMMMTRLACNRAIESSYWRMDNEYIDAIVTGVASTWCLVWCNTIYSVNRVMVPAVDVTTRFVRGLLTILE
jgi:hypothetical protein